MSGPPDDEQLAAAELAAVTGLPLPVSTTLPTEVDCEHCEGDGRVTDDQFEQPWPKVMREILKDEETEARSRTRDAIESGALKFIECDACAGTGKLPA